jgi:hypothetical protein
LSASQEEALDASAARTAPDPSSDPVTGADLGEAKANEDDPESSLLG